MRTSSRLAVAAIAFSAWAAGCATTPPMFPGITDMSSLRPGERVVIGQIQYTDGTHPNGDLSDWLPDSYRDSWPQFTYDYGSVRPPERVRHGPPFGSRGGVFAFVARAGQPVYFPTIWVESHSFWKGTTSLWTLPIHLKLPPSSDACVFVGTIVVRVSGFHAPETHWWEGYGKSKSTGDEIGVTVYDTYERDRAASASWVKGCDLRKALAEPPTYEEIEALLAPLRAEQAARDTQKSAEDEQRYQQCLKTAATPGRCPKPTPR